jgi:hypothetical protein
MDELQSGTPQRVPTHIEFLDRLLGGGQLPTGIHGLLGVIGSGKTTLGTMIATEGALWQGKVDQYQATGCWVFISLEMRPEEIRALAISHAAKISRRTIQTERSDQWSTSACLKDYELQRTSQLSTRGGSGLGEQERYEEIAGILTSHLVIARIDPPEFASVCSAAQGIRNYLTKLRLEDRPIRGIVVDYAGLAVLHYVNQNSIPNYASSAILSNFPQECRELLAQQYNCPVWVIHQMSGRANKRRPTEIQHHSDTQGCRSFGAYLDTCVILGTMEDKSAAFAIQCTKSPQKPDSDRAVLQFDQDFATIVEANHLRQSNGSHQFVSAAPVCELIGLSPDLIEYAEELARRVSTGGGKQQKGGRGGRNGRRA